MSRHILTKFTGATSIYETITHGRINMTIRVYGRGIYEYIRDDDCDDDDDDDDDDVCERVRRRNKKKININRKKRKKKKLPNKMVFEI